VLEIGRDRQGTTWSAIPALVEAHIVELAGDDLSSRHMSSELESLDLPLELVVDHPLGRGDRAIGAIEMFFGRIAPGGIHVVDGSLPTETELTLMLATVVSPDLVAQVELTSTAVILERGPLPPFVDVFSLADITSDPFEIVA
jgi:hypothetical protein